MRICNIKMPLSAIYKQSIGTHKVFKKIMRFDGAETKEIVRT
jgi:hypothetical protein